MWEFDFCDEDFGEESFVFFCECVVGEFDYEVGCVVSGNEWD